MAKETITAGPASWAAAAAGHHENARPDDAADAQRGQRHRPQHAVQAVFAGHLGQQHLQVLSGEDVFPTHAVISTPYRHQHSRSREFAVAITLNLDGKLVETPGVIPKCLQVFGRHLPYQGQCFSFDIVSCRFWFAIKLLFLRSACLVLRVQRTLTGYQQGLGCNQPRLDHFNGNDDQNGPMTSGFPGYPVKARSRGFDGGEKLAPSATFRRGHSVPKMNPMTRTSRILMSRRGHQVKIAIVVDTDHGHMGTLSVEPMQRPGNHLKNKVQTPP